MAISFSYSPETNILNIKVTGYLTLDDYFSALTRLLESSEIPANVNAIWDIQEMEFDNIDIKFQQAIVDWHKQHNNPRSKARIAMVSDYSLGDPILKLFKQIGKEQYQEMEVFRTIDEAKLWLSH